MKQLRRKTSRYLVIWCSQLLAAVTMAVYAKQHVLIGVCRPSYWAYQGNPNLVHVDVGIGGDDRASSIVHPLSHHVFAKQPFLLFQNLLDVYVNNMYAFVCKYVCVCVCVCVCVSV